MVQIPIASGKFGEVALLESSAIQLPETGITLMARLSFPASRAFRIREVSLPMLAICCAKIQINMKSYLKFLSRNKLYTAIEAVGLAVWATRLYLERYSACRRTASR